MALSGAVVGTGPAFSPGSSRHGSSPCYSDRDSSRIVHTFWALAGALEIDVWFEYVRSAANIADWPSRDKLDFVPDLGARVVDPWVCPPTEAWGSVEAVLRVAESVPERPAKRARS